MKKQRFVFVFIAVLLSSTPLYSQSDLYKQIANSPWVKGDIKLNCDSLPGDTHSELICLTMGKIKRTH